VSRLNTYVNGGDRRGRDFGFGILISCIWKDACAGESPLALRAIGIRRNSQIRIPNSESEIGPVFGVDEEWMQWRGVWGSA